MQDDFYTCLSNKLDTAKLHADKVNIEIDAKFDLMDCSMGDTVTLSKAELKFRMWIGCPDGDVEDLDGKTLLQASEVETDCGEHMDHQVMFNFSLDMDYTTTVETQAGEQINIAVDTLSIDALQTASGKPCEQNHSGSTYTLSDRCQTVEKYTSLSNVVGSTSQGSMEDYTRLGFRSLTVEDSGDPTWYSSGSMDVVVNNWTGSLTFGGATTAPTYSLTDGTNTVEGTIGEGGSLRGATANTAKARVLHKVAQLRAGMATQGN
jgi:hypothetical protein